MTLTRDLVVLFGVLTTLMSMVVLTAIIAPGAKADKQVQVWIPEINAGKQVTDYRVVLPEREIDREANLAALRAQLQAD